MLNDRWVDHIDVECQSLEERHSVFSTHFLKHHCKLVVGDLFDKMTLELHNDMISSKDGAECVALLTKEAEAVALKNKWVIESSLNACLSRHNSEIFHVFEALVANLYSESEGLSLGVDISRADLLKLDFGKQFLDSLLNDWVVLVEHV